MQVHFTPAAQVLFVFAVEATTHATTLPHMLHTPPPRATLHVPLLRAATAAALSHHSRAAFTTVYFAIYCRHRAGCTFSRAFTTHTCLRARAHTRYARTCRRLVGCCSNLLQHTHFLSCLCLVPFAHAARASATLLAFLLPACTPRAHATHTLRLVDTGLLLHTHTPVHALPISRLPAATHTTSFRCWGHFFFCWTLHLCGYEFSALPHTARASTATCRAPPTTTAPAFVPHTLPRHLPTLLLHTAACCLYLCLLPTLPATYLCLHTCLPLHYHTATYLHAISHACTHLCTCFVATHTLFTIFSFCRVRSLPLLPGAYFFGLLVVGRFGRGWVRWSIPLSFILFPCYLPPMQYACPAPAFYCMAALPPCALLLLLCF